MLLTTFLLLATYAFAGPTMGQSISPETNSQIPVGEAVVILLLKWALMTFWFYMMFCWWPLDTKKPVKIKWGAWIACIIVSAMAMFVFTFNARDPLCRNHPQISFYEDFVHKCDY